MGGFLLSIGWFRFTVRKTTVDEVMNLIGGDWIKAERGWQGYVLPFRVLPELAQLLGSQWEKTLSLELTSDHAIPWVFYWSDRGTVKPIHPKALYRRWETACKAAGVPERIPHDFRRTAVRNLERAGVPRSVAMKITGHLTEADYRRYAIVSEADLAEGLKKLAALSVKTEFGHTSGGKTSILAGNNGGGGEI